jgi:hypothetical protein
MTTDPNFDAILHVIDSLQLTAHLRHAQGFGQDIAPWGVEFG